MRIYGEACHGERRFSRLCFGSPPPAKTAAAFGSPSNWRRRENPGGRTYTLLASLIGLTAAGKRRKSANVK